MLQHFTYLAPRTRAELHGVLADEGAAASLLAGGTDLLVNLRAGLARPKIVVDTKKVEGLAGVDWSERDGLVISAGVTLNALLADAKTRSDYPLLVACAHDLASHQIRNRATVIGNVVNASPCADMAPALLCLRAHAVISSKRGEREIPFSAFFKGVKRTAVAPNEVVLLVVFEVKMSSVVGMINLAIPSIILEPVANKFDQEMYTGYKKSGTFEEARLLMESMKRCDMAVAAEIRGTNLRLSEILALQEGDLIPLAKWPEETRLLMRRERPRPGAQLTLFDTAEGFRHTCFITNTKGSDIASLELRQRGHARVEDRIRNWGDVPRSGVTLPVHR